MKGYVSYLRLGLSYYKSLMLPNLVLYKFHLNVGRRYFQHLLNLFKLLLLPNRDSELLYLINFFHRFVLLASNWLSLHKPKRV